MGVGAKEEGGDEAPLVATLLLEEVVVLGTLESRGRSRLLGPGDANRERVCKNEDFLFFSVTPFSKASSVGWRGTSGSFRSGCDDSSLRCRSRISPAVRVRVM